MPLRRAKRLFLRRDGIFIARKALPAVRIPEPLRRGGSKPAFASAPDVSYLWILPLGNVHKFDIAIAYSYLCGSICDNL